jgi:hypothetical protein
VEMASLADLWGWCMGLATAQVAPGAPATEMLLARFSFWAYAYSRCHAEASRAACADVVSFCEILDQETTEASSVRLALPRRWTCSWESM